MLYWQSVLARIHHKNSVYNDFTNTDEFSAVRKFHFGIYEFMI